MDKSLVKIAEQSYYLHDLVLDFAKDELRRLRAGVHVVTSRQARYLGTLSVLDDYARAGEVLSGFYALMALWRSVEELCGDKQLKLRTYEASLKPRCELTEGVAYSNWAAGRLFELQVGYKHVDVRFIRISKAGSGAVRVTYSQVDKNVLRLK